MNLVIKGLIIGIGKILPGISGAMLAMMIGEYERIIYSISTINENSKEKIKYLTKIGLGIILAISLISKIIVKCFNKYYLPTMLLFLGLIIGDIIKIEKTKILKKYIHYKNIYIVIIVVTILQLGKKMIDINININLSKKTFKNLIIVGMIEAVASIIPGISGTAILLKINCYDTIIKTFATIFDYNCIIQNLKIIIPFFLGFIVGIFIITRLLSKINKITIKKIKQICEIISIYIITKEIREYKTIHLKKYIKYTIIIVGALIPQLIEMINKKSTHLKIEE